MTNSSSRRGLTRFDLIVILFVILLLSCIMWPAIGAMREAARRQACINNLKRLGLAIHNFHSAQKKFPSSNDLPLLDVPSNSWVQVPLHTPATLTGKTLHGTNYSWLARLLPHIEGGEWVGLDYVNRLAWDPCKDNPIDPITKMPKTYNLPCHPLFWSSPITCFKCPSFGEEDFCQANPAVGITTNPYAPGTDHGPAGLTNYVALGATHSDSLMGVETNPLAGGPDHPNGTIFPASRITLQDLAKGGGANNTLIVCETREPTLAAWYEGSTAAVFGLAGQPAFEKSKKPGSSYGVPAAGTRTTLNLGDETSNPVTYYLKSGPQGIPWLHGPSSCHPGIVNHLLGDGSVRSVQDGLSPTLYMQLITRY